MFRSFPTFSFFKWLSAYTLYNLYPPTYESDIGLVAAIRSVLIPRYAHFRPRPSIDIHMGSPENMEMIVGVLEESRGNNIPGHGGTRLYVFFFNPQYEVDPFSAALGRGYRCLDLMEFTLLEDGKLIPEDHRYARVIDVMEGGPYNPPILKVLTRPNPDPKMPIHFEVEAEVQALMTYYGLDKIIPRDRGSNFYTFTYFE